tara:strand:- start:124 stop:660 length:537 start_codon:yes stop_codon:yes gene_type:complete
MASELHVDAIKHSGGTSALTIDSSGNVHKAGLILQSVEESNSNWTAVSSSSYAYANVGVGITPKFSTSKIQVLININGIYASTPGNAIFFELYRDIGGGGYSSISTLGGITGNTDASDYGPRDGTLACSFLDSPSTTSAITYRIYWLVSGGGTGGLNNYVGSTNGVTRSSAVAMEVAQ